MPTRMLDVALWDYRDRDGRKRRARYRETFDLPDAETERGQRAGAFAAEPTDRESPPQNSTNGALVDWLVEHRGADRDDIKRLNKQTLWQLVNSG